MNVFLQELSKAYADDEILLVCDGAMWHKSSRLMIPTNIHIIHIPPYTPEMNPIEQIWKEIRKCGFRNEVFKTQEHVVERLCEIIKNLPISVIQSITDRQWSLNIV
ncbi:MAG: transposase [Christensenellales bacterium]